MALRKIIAVKTFLISIFCLILLVNFPSFNTLFRTAEDYRRHFNEVARKLERNLQKCPSDDEIAENAERRKQQLLKACRENIQLLRENNATLLKAYAMKKPFLISKKLKVVYCEIPKIGRTNVLNYLYYWNSGVTMAEIAKLSRKDRFLVYQEFDRHSDKGSGFRRVWESCHVTNVWKGYFTFVFVRDPLQRILSGWQERIYENDVDYKRMAFQIGIILRAVRKNSSHFSDEELLRVPKPTLGEFFEYMAAEDDSTKLNVHWRPQMYTWQFCDINFDFIGTLEDMTCQMEHIARRFSNIGQKVVPKMVTDDTSWERSKRRSNYLKMVPKELVKKVLMKHYLIDYKILGYKFPEFL